MAETHASKTLDSMVSGGVLPTGDGLRDAAAVARTEVERLRGLAFADKEGEDVLELAAAQLRIALQRFASFQSPRSPLHAVHSDLRDAAETIWHLARTVNILGPFGK